MSAGHVGRPVPRDSNEYRFVAGVIRAVEQLSGRPSRWNGELNEELRPGAVGSALDDGGMTVNVDEVLKPIAHAYTAGRPLTEVELLQVRDAVLTLVHEARHLSHRFGDEHSPGGVPAYSADALVLEEGLTETWAHQHVDAVIQHLGMDKVQPELLDAETFDSYPAYTAATDEVVRGTAEVCGLSPSAVRETLERADRTQRLAALADLVIDQRLADVMPAEERDTVKVQLVQQLRQPLGDVVPVQKSELVSDVGKTIAGHQCAQRAVTALSTTTAELEDRYRDMRQLQKFLGGQRPARRAVDTQRPTRSPEEPGRRTLRQPAGRGHAVE